MRHLCIHHLQEHCVFLGLVEVNLVSNINYEHHNPILFVVFVLREFEFNISLIFLLFAAGWCLRDLRALYLPIYNKYVVCDVVLLLEFKDV